GLHHFPPPPDPEGLMGPWLLVPRQPAGPHLCPGPRPPNRLGQEKSPFLLQLAYSPVDWFPWGQEAFDKAKKDNKVIFLSVGYSTCHWCHMMEEECFRCPAIGRILSDHFVSIKVDREERPDVDKVYMAFVQTTSSGGGWPMSVWLTPSLQPFLGGTYFPPEDGVSHIGFRTILLRVLEQWKHNRTSLLENAQRLTEALQARLKMAAGAREEPPPAEEVSDHCFRQLADAYDEEYGGFGNAPKFPSPVNITFLLTYWAQRRSLSEGSQALHMALHTLKMVAHGGIRDHVGQGFHHYSTDQGWNVPHFEKMLSDQGQLAVVYAKAFQVSGDQFFADVARGILLYVSRDLSHKSGGFFSAEDADSFPDAGSSRRKEGAFYVWSAAEIQRLLPEPIVDATEPLTLGQIICHHYGVKETGNVSPTQDLNGELQGQNVLTAHYSLELTAARYGLGVEPLRALLATGQKYLFEVRSQRPRPRLDTKMLAAWNGLMISGFARAGAILGQEDLVQRAISGATFLQRHLSDPGSGRLLRCCYVGHDQAVEASSQPIWGFPEDYACVIQALLDVYEASGDTAWLEWALQLQSTQDRLFWDPQSGGYFCSDPEDPYLPLCLKDDQDGAEPSANSVSASNLLRIVGFSDRRDWKDECVQLLAAFSGRLLRAPVALPELVRVLATHQQSLKQVVICGDPQARDTQALLRTVHSVFVPNRVLIQANSKSSGFLFRQLPFLASLSQWEGEATAYVWENDACSLPITSPRVLRKFLQK
uniref:Spermatogenesis-associated protein 20 n=1 Tax=Ornithorhynchus anatinus TaxID=9258 RepID=K7EI59_ORNAN